MVLLAALLAPAVLALGLFVAELTEFGVPPYLRARPAVPPVFMAPTPLPRPLTPDRLYEGRVPAPQKKRPKRQPPQARVVAAPEAKHPPTTTRTPEPPKKHHPPEVRAACPDEWTDTWLWELCQEEARKPA
ncbi:hypothetical protein HerbRD11066_42290 [Herbidospora sp. RD11066]